MRKNKQFSIRISSQNLETIRRKAIQAHMTQSDYVTACCLGKRIVILNGLKEVLRLAHRGRRGRASCGRDPVPHGYQILPARPPRLHRADQIPARAPIQAKLNHCTAPKPPLCKGRWHGAAVTEGL